MQKGHRTHYGPVIVFLTYLAKGPTQTKEDHVPGGIGVADAEAHEAVPSVGDPEEVHAVVHRRPEVHPEAGEGVSGGEGEEYGRELGRGSEWNKIQKV